MGFFDEPNLGLMLLSSWRSKMDFDPLISIIIKSPLKCASKISLFLYLDFQFHSDNLNLRVIFSFFQFDFSDCRTNLIQLLLIDLLLPFFTELT